MKKIVLPRIAPMPTTKDIEYGKGGDVPLLLDIYLPETPIASPMPAIIWIHGGGWRSKDKYPDLEHSEITWATIPAFVRQGFFVASINYRLSGVAPFPAAIEDCKCAVRWLRANAEKYNVDPNRIGIGGASAGGHLAMLIGCADETAGLEGNGGWAEFSSQVQAVCSYFGPSDFASLSEFEARFESTRPQARAYLDFLGGTIEEKPDVYRHASPITHVTQSDPPLLMVYGEFDDTVPFSQAETMYQAYQRVGAEVTLVKVTGAGHGFRQATSEPISPSREEIEQITIDFFMKNPLHAK